MFQTFISRHNSNFFSDKLVLTSVTPASSAPVLQTPKATSSTLYFDSLTVNAGNGGFLHCIQKDTSVNAANQVVSVGADIAFDADPKFFACLVRFESSSVPTTLPTRSEERFSRNAETDLVCRLLLEKKKESEYRLLAIVLTGLPMAARTIHWLARPHLVTPIVTRIFCCLLN